MSKITEEEIKKILPLKGPSFEEVKNYLDKYNDEYVVIKCGGSILVDKSLFNNFIKENSNRNTERDSYYQNTGIEYFFSKKAHRLTNPSTTLSDIAYL